MSSWEDLDLMEKEAIRLHREAKELNARGALQEAQATYLRMYALEDESLSLAAKLSEQASSATTERRSAAAAAVPLGYQEVHKLQAWPAWPPSRPSTTSSSAGEEEGEACRRRAVGMVLGALVGDAAAMGVHWVYDLDVLAELDRQRGSRGALEFFTPPQSPYFSYQGGRASPYGEQTKLLLSSIVRHGGFSAILYAKDLAGTYGEGWDGYRDASIKGFLRRWYRGHLPPKTGADDCQVNCITRLAPLVAAFGGDTHRMLTMVEYATRVTQDHDSAVAWGLGAARVLEAIVVEGRIPTEAVTQAIQEMKDPGSVLSSHMPDGDGEDLGAEVVYYLDQCLRAVPRSTVSQAVAILGRNCHLPNSAQTPVHAALYYSSSSPQQPQQRAGTSQSSGGTSATETEEGDVQEPPPPPPLPSSSPYQPPPLPRDEGSPRWRFMSAIRASIREGGCCASRASFVGAMLGGYWGPDVIPGQWKEQVNRWQEDVHDQAHALNRMRDEGAAGGREERVVVAAAAAAAGGGGGGVVSGFGIG